MTDKVRAAPETTSRRTFMRRVLRTAGYMVPIVTVMSMRNFAHATHREPNHRGGTGMGMGMGMN